MTIDQINNDVNENPQELTTTETSEASTDSIITEIIPSMDEFKEELAHSFKKIEEGDLIEGTVIGISDTALTLDLQYYTEGIITIDELSHDPNFSIKGDVQIGDVITSYVLKEDDTEGNLLLSKKRADDILAWDILKEALQERTVKKVSLSGVVNGGMTTYLDGIRAFIPASQLSLSYVENLNDWLKKEVEVIVITADENDKRLVLSAKEVEKEKALADRNHKISNLQTGIVTTGIVEKITPYGAFVRIADNLSGLVHISQICGRRIKSPNEVIKEGQEVTVKIIDIKEGKISLSMKAVEEKEDVFDEVDDTPFEYSTGGSASTDLGSLLANLKL